MKSVYLFSVLISLSFCSSIFAQQTIVGEFTSGEEERWYRGAVPDTPQTPLRLVILLAGTNENVFEIESRGFNNYLGNNTMVVYPQPFNFAAGFTATDGVDDFQMVEDMIAHVASNHAIDTNDICIGGFSSGGRFAYNLICDFNSPTSTRSYRFKSLAVVSGFVDTTYMENCIVANQVPLIAFHGTEDQVAEYSSGTFAGLDTFPIEPTETIVDFWATEINGCNNTPTVTALPDLVTEQWLPSTPELLDYECPCSNNTQLYRIVGGAHAWPGGNAQVDFWQDANMDINASELIADFFECSTTVVSTTQVNVDTGSLSVYPNPVINDLTIETNEDLRLVEVYSSTGKKVFGSTQPNRTISFDHLTAGIYFLRIETEAGTVMKKIIKN